MATGGNDVAADDTLGPQIVSVARCQFSGSKAVKSTRFSDVASAYLR